MQVKAAARFTIGNLKFTVNDGGESVSISRNGEVEGELKISSTVTRPSDGKTYRVTSIGANAFNGCSGLTSVEIPSSVTSIGAWAFIGCSGLKSITSLIEEPSEWELGGCGFTIYVPQGTKEKYEEKWGNNNIYVEISSGIPTNMAVVAGAKREDGVYDMSGRYEGKTTEGLRRGMYVVVENGKARIMMEK